MTPAQSLSKQIIDAMYEKGIIDRATDVVRARAVAEEKLKPLVNAVGRACKCSSDDHPEMFKYFGAAMDTLNRIYGELTAPRAAAGNKGAPMSTKKPAMPPEVFEAVKFIEAHCVTGGSAFSCAQFIRKNFTEPKPTKLTTGQEIAKWHLEVDCLTDADDLLVNRIDAAIAAGSKAAVAEKLRRVREAVGSLLLSTYGRDATRDTALAIIDRIAAEAK